jgi:electron transport complex protein RnfC
MNLMPLFINAYVMNGKIKETEKFHVNDCIECGCCSYVCPAARRLVMSIRFAKSELRRMASLKKPIGG